MSTTLKDAPDDPAPELSERQRKILIAIGDAQNQIRQIANAVGSSAPTIGSDLLELQDRGLVTAKPLMTRGRPMEYALSPDGIALTSRLRSRVPTPSGDRATSLGLPVGLALVRLDRSKQRDCVRRLRDAGAETVFDAVGDSDIVATYPIDAVPAITSLLRDLAEHDETTRTHQTLLMTLHPTSRNIRTRP